MRFLSQVPWPPELEKKIQITLSKQGIPLHEELKARLDIPDKAVLLDMASRELRAMLSSGESCTFERFAKRLMEDDKVAMISIVQKEWRARFDKLKTVRPHEYHYSMALTPFYNLTKLMIDMEQLPIVVEVLVAENFVRHGFRNGKVVELTVVILKAVLSGQVLLETRVRGNLAGDILVSQLPITKEDREILSDLLVCLIKTLPLVEVENLLKIYRTEDIANWFNYADLLDWWHVKILTGSSHLASSR